MVLSTFLWCCLVVCGVVYLSVVWSNVCPKKAEIHWVAVKFCAPEIIRWFCGDPGIINCVVIITNTLMLSSHNHIQKLKSSYLVFRTEVVK